jgi:hypothetical protein
VSDAAGHLADGRQPLGPLLAGGVLGLVGVLDQGQVQIEQGVQGPADGQQRAGVATWPGVLQGVEQAAAQPRQGHVGVDLAQADLDVPPADTPAPGHVGAVVAAREQFTQPLHQGALEALDLGGAAGEDLAGLGVAVDLGVEVLDERAEVGLEQRRHRSDQEGVLVGPADVGLHLLVAVEELLGVHGGPFGRPAGPGRACRAGRSLVHDKPPAPDAEREASRVLADESKTCADPTSGPRPAGGLQRQARAAGARSQGGRFRHTLTRYRTAEAGHPGWACRAYPCLLRKGRAPEAGRLPGRERPGVCHAHSAGGGVFLTPVGA